MAHLALVDGLRLAQWADAVTSEHTFPRIIRRLVLGTTDGITHISFPADEAVRLAGWDGTVVTSTGHAFVPQGLSVWELGTNRNVKAKADEDYQKRAEDPRGVNPADTTYIFVTPRRWGGKQAWIDAKQAEGVWKEVRAYDATDLMTWLEVAPSVHIWLSGEIDDYPSDAIDLETSWLNWREVTAPPTVPELVLAGRQESRDAIVSWFRTSSSSVLSVQAESRDEAQAVVAAALLSLPEEERDVYFSRSVVVRSLPAWMQLSAFRESLVLIHQFDSPESVSQANRQGHRVVIPLGMTDTGSKPDITVPRLSLEDAIAALRASGVPESAAREKALLARRSLTSYRRQHSRFPALQAPEWATPGQASSLVPALLAGAWSAEMQGDRAVIAALARRTYAEAQEFMLRWAHLPDPPVRVIANTWYLVSKEDAWGLLASFLTRDDYSAFEEVVMAELGVSDPRFDLPINERWHASERPRISGHLRSGLAETLAILGARAIEPTPASGVAGRTVARSLVRRLLEPANANWRIWASLPLPLLAEAAPDEFLDAVEDGLRGPDPVLFNLFEPDADPLFSTSSHTYLLWALEVIAWSPEYLSRAAYCLAKLARLDPGGKTSNRPAASLIDIFALQIPHTSAAIEQRLQVLEGIRQRELEVAWHLYLALIPGSNAAITSTPTPRWRDWAPEEPPDTYNVLEVQRAVGELLRRLVEVAAADADRWASLIEWLPRLHSEHRNILLERLSIVDPRVTGDRAIEVWGQLRALISRHRSYSDAPWAFPPEFVDRLEEVYRRWTPDCDLLQVAWLFDDRPDLPEGRERDYEEYESAVQTARQNALNRFA